MLYGPDNLRIEDITKPKPADDELLIRVEACGICASDLKILAGTFPGIRYPLVPGHELSGEVVALGKNVDEFNLGEKVATEPHSGCGRCDNCIQGNYTVCLNSSRISRSIGQTVNGGFAEFCAVPEKSAHKLPDVINFEEGAMVSIAGTALCGLERVRVDVGDTVVVFGSGAIGLTAIQLAKSLGAANVVSIGTNADKMHRFGIAKRVGADFVVNVDNEDPVKRVLDLTQQRGADVVVEATGVAEVAGSALEVVRRGGRVLLLSNYGKDRKGVINLSRVMLDALTVVGSRGSARGSCERVIRLMEKKSIDLSSLVTHRYSLVDIIKGYDLFKSRAESVIRVVIKP